MDCKKWIEEIEQAETLCELDRLNSSTLGKSGVFAEEFKKIATMQSIVEKKEYGENLNIAKDQITAAIKKQRSKIEDKMLCDKLAGESVDVTLPVTDSRIGGAHVISSSIKRLRAFYQSRGFLVLDGPEIDSEFYNFDALNMPLHHPARQSHDTFYIKDADGMLLRTHTSTVQIRTMIKKGAVPIRMVSMGKTYRSDSLDMTHSPMFHQLECLVVDKKPISVGNLISELRKLIAFFFERASVDDVAIRLRPSYFPFTEPGVEVDCKYLKKNGELVISKDGDKWLELGGAGIVHPNVYKACGLDHTDLYGFAFGFGIERLTMLKHGIQDIRNLYDTDTRWLKHYASLS